VDCSTTGQSLYQVLELEQTASEEEIKRAYRKVVTRNAVLYYSNNWAKAVDGHCYYAKQLIDATFNDSTGQLGTVVWDL